MILTALPVPVAPAGMAEAKPSLADITVFAYVIEDSNKRVSPSWNVCPVKDVDDFSYWT